MIQTNSPQDVCCTTVGRQIVLRRRRRALASCTRSGWFYMKRVSRMWIRRGVLPPPSRPPGAAPAVVLPSLCTVDSPLPPAACDGGGRPALAMGSAPAAIIESGWGSIPTSRNALMRNSTSAHDRAANISLCVAISLGGGWFPLDDAAAAVGRLYVDRAIFLVEAMFVLRCFGASLH